MAFALSPGLALCPKEAAVIGALIANYGELEFALCTCLGVVLGDSDTALRVMYRDRGEDRRISLCRELMRLPFAKIGLEDHFMATIAQVDWCKTIRNQYAHSWFSFVGRKVGSGVLARKPTIYTLKVISLEEAVKGGQGVSVKESHSIKIDLLNTQAAYFENALAWLKYLTQEAEKAAGISPSQPISKPTRPEKPPRYSDTLKR